MVNDDEEDRVIGVIGLWVQPCFFEAEIKLDKPREWCNMKKERPALSIVHPLAAYTDKEI